VSEGGIKDGEARSVRVRHGPYSTAEERRRGLARAKAVRERAGMDANHLPGVMGMVVGGVGVGGVGVGGAGGAGGGMGRSGGKGRKTAAAGKARQQQQQRQQEQQQQPPQQYEYESYQSYEGAYDGGYGEGDEYDEYDQHGHYDVRYEHYSATDPSSATAVLQQLRAQKGACASAAREMATAHRYYHSTSTAPYPIHHALTQSAGDWRRRRSSSSTKRGGQTRARAARSGRGRRRVRGGREVGTGIIGGCVYRPLTGMCRAGEG
jgi:hypothetical protein